MCVQAVERWTRGSEAIPSLYVFECVELELTLKLAAGEEEEPAESDFTCPIRLHRGKGTPRSSPLPSFSKPEEPSQAVTVMETKEN